MGLKKGFLKYLQLFLSRAGALWKQWPAISSLLFSSARFGLKSMYHFSCVHKPQTPVVGENGWALANIFQLISKFDPSSLNCHTFLLNLVSLLYFLWLIDFVWFLNLSLNEVACIVYVCINTYIIQHTNKATY